MTINHPPFRKCFSDYFAQANPSNWKFWITKNIKSTTLFNPDNQAPSLNNSSESRECSDATKCDTTYQGCAIMNQWLMHWGIGRIVRSDSPRGVNASLETPPLVMILNVFVALIYEPNVGQRVSYVMVSVASYYRTPWITKTLEYRETA